MSEYYNKMASEYPNLAPYFLDVTQGVIYGAFGAYIGGPVGLAGALFLVLEQKAAGAVVDAVAGEKIKAVMEAGIEKTAEGLRKFDVELSYEDSIYLALGVLAGGALVLGLKGEAKSLIGAANGGVDKILHSTKNIIGDIKHKVDLDSQKSSNIKVDFNYQKILSAIESKDSQQISAAFKENRGWDISLETLNKVPKELWKQEIELARTFDKLPGIKFSDNKGNHVRIMKGSPNAKHASQQQDYVKIVSGGKTLGRDGTVLDDTKFAKPSTHPTSHIPLNEWKNWKEWNKK